MEQTSKLPRVAMGSCLIESLQSASPLKIQFKRGYEEKDCVKLVLAPDELRCAMEGGESICFKGTRGKLDAVICTGAKTFRLKKVETSNSVLVAPSLPAHDSGVYEVVAKSSHYYETTLSKPECEDLIEILKGSEYRGYEEEGDISFHSKSTLYTEKQLGDMILCSEDELRRMLKVVGAIDIDGYMRLCSHQALHDLNAVLINTIIEKDWDTRNISREKCVAEISNVDILVLDHALGRLGEKNPDGNTWTLFEKNLACAVAHLILKETREVEVEEFMSLWHSRTPGSLILSEELLRGIATKSGDGSKFVYFPVEALSWQENTRFQELYQHRNRYTLEEIEPYIQDFCSATDDDRNSGVMGLLLKYTKPVEGYYIPSEFLKVTN